MSKKILSFLIVGSIFALQVGMIFISMERAYATVNVPDTGGSNTFTLPNPLKYGSLCALLTGILDLIVEIAAIVAVIMIIWVGLRFIRAQGNENEIKNAKAAFLNTILGTGILLGASVIAKIVVNTILSIAVSNPGNGSTPAC